MCYFGDYWNDNKLPRSWKFLLRIIIFRMYKTIKLNFSDKNHVRSFFMKRHCDWWVYTWSWANIYKGEDYSRNTPGTAGNPGGRDQTLAVKSRNFFENQLFFIKKNKNYLTNIFFCIYLLVMPKYWGEQIFTHGIFPEVVQKQKTEKKERKKEERKTKWW